MSISRRTAMFVAVAVLAVAGITACGDDDAAPSATEAVTPTVPLATAAASTSPVTTVPAPTAPVTTIPVATATAPTTIPVETAGWQPVEFVPAVVGVGYSSNYEGEASPPRPSGDDQPLADGYYHAQLSQPWLSSEPGVLHVEIRGFAPCDDIAGMCFENTDPVEELGIDPRWERFVEVPLDDSTRVVLRGFGCFPDVGPVIDEVMVGTGTQLADLFESYTVDVESVIEPLLHSGVERYQLETEVVEALAGSSDGFVPEADHCDSASSGGPLRYVHDDAPVLLLQTLFEYDSEPARVRNVSDVARLEGVDVRDGVPTLYFYAGFYS